MTSRRTLVAGVGCGIAAGVGDAKLAVVGHNGCLGLVCEGCDGALAEQGAQCEKVGLEGGSIGAHHDEATLACMPSGSKELFLKLFVAHPHMEQQSACV